MEMRKWRYASRPLIAGTGWTEAEGRGSSSGEGGRESLTTRARITFFLFKRTSELYVACRKVSPGLEGKPTFCRVLIVI